MSQTNLPLTFGDTSAVKLRDFLRDCPEFMRELGKRMPRSGDAKTTEDAANSGQRAEGFLVAIDAIESMAAGKPPATKSAYIQEKPDRTL